MDPTQLEAAQKADLAWTEATIGDAERRIAALDQNLKPEILAEREGEIRRKLAETLGERRNAMIQRAADAEALARQYRPETVLRRARFADDPDQDATRRLATFATLGRTPTGELLAHLEDAVGENNLALAEAVRVELASREDRDTVRESFVALFDRLQVPGAEALETLQRVQGHRAMAEARIGEAVSGRSNARARLAAARMSGSGRRAA